MRLFHGRNPFIDLRKKLRMFREATLFEAAGPVEVSAELAVSAVFRYLSAVLLHRVVLFVLQLPVVV